MPAARAGGAPLADDRAQALSQARAQDRIRGQMMQVALKRLLDQVPGSRRALPHLAALEDGLGRRGACAAEQVPPHWLGRIINQLSGLPLRDDDHELQELLSRLCRALADHQRPPQSLPVLTEAYSPPPALASRPLHARAIAAGPKATPADAYGGAATAGTPARPMPPRPAWAEAPAFYADHPAVRSQTGGAPLAAGAGPSPASAPAPSSPLAPLPPLPPLPPFPPVPSLVPSPPEPVVEAVTPALDEDGLPRFTTMPNASELDLEPEVFQTFFGDRLRPPERTSDAEEPGAPASTDPGPSPSVR